MADNDADDTSPSSSHPFFVRSGFPFVFLPSTLTAGFNFMNNNHTHGPSTDDQATVESPKSKENDANTEEEEEEEEEEETAETIDDDEGDRNDENDESSNEKSNVRISQPEYSQLLKELDFSQARMVDVTNLLPNESDQQENQSMSDENENLQKSLDDANESQQRIEDNENDNQKLTTDDEKYQSLSSAASTDEVSDHQTYNNTNNKDTDDSKTKEDDHSSDAVNDIQNDLNNLATIINQASHISTDKNQDEDNEHSKNDIPRKNTLDEEDDTSKQATQDYDLHDNEPENGISSSKSSKLIRINNQNSTGIRYNNKSTTSELDKHINPPIGTTREETIDIKEQPRSSFNWENLVHGNDPITQQSNEMKSSEQIIESHSTPKKHSQPSTLPEDKSKPQRNSFTKQNVSNRSRPAMASSSSSSSDSGSIVEYALHHPKDKHSSPVQLKQPIPRVVQPQTLRQDSQETLIDENLDDLSSQLKQVFFDQDRQTLSTSTKDERTTDGFGSMPFQLSVLSTALLGSESTNQTDETLVRHPSNPRMHHHPQRHRHTFDIPERSNLHRKKSHHHHHHQRHPPSHHVAPNESVNSRTADDNWLTMLEKLEREHKTRIEKQQQQYADYMHTLDSKMKRRFDDYLTLTNDSQDSRPNIHDSTVHANRTHTSIPIDSNIGKYKSTSYNNQYRPVAKDLISHYYPADSTLNILTSEKKRSPIINNTSESESKEDITNLRTQLSARHGRYVDDLKLRYEQEINNLKNQLNRIRLGHTSNITRQSIETIERINNENVRLRDEVNELRHSSKMSDEENILLKRQSDELREQINHKDVDMKNYHRTIVDLERQLNETENTKERQNEKLRHADRQTSLYREENEKIKIDLNRTRERLLRLEERSRDQENENERLRRRLFLLENDNNRIRNRMTDDHKLSTAMISNISSPRDYDRFTIPVKAQHSSSTISTPRDGIIDSGRYQSNDAGTSFHHNHSPRTMTKISDYLNEKAFSSQPYISPSRHVYSPRKPSPNPRRVESTPRRSLIDKQARQTEHLEQKFDQLLKKKRDLETRLNRIPIRGFTNTDQQLFDVLEREINRVEQQITNVKLDLRKSNTLRTH